MLVVFDLDGTLIDSVADLAASASELVTALGGRRLTEFEVAAMVGEGARILVTRALVAAGLDPDTPGALERFLEIYDRRLLDTTTVYDGIDDALLMASRRARMSVLTNKPSRPSRRILEALNLTRYFADIVGGDGPHGRKPDPAGLRALMKGEPRALLVGDSPIDWRTAQAAGCWFAWARYGFGAARFDGEMPPTAFVLGQPADLCAILDRFEATTTGT